MKPIEELRKEFESNKYIQETIVAQGAKYQKQGWYFCVDVGSCGWLNGAWFMFQELNK